MDENKNIMEPISEVYNMDCMEGMIQYPDNYFDLAVVDPPYGIKADRAFVRNTPAIDKRNGRQIITKKKLIGNWDNNRPDMDYFNELQRVSKNQIIWGGNYFADLLPAKSCWIVWDKVNGGSDQADCELAYTSFKTAVRLVRYMWTGLLQAVGTSNGTYNQGNKSLCEKRIHPTQKPVALYDWIFSNYAKPGMKILDTHLGSQSSRIAAHRAGLDFVGYELDKDYFEQGNKRFNDYKSQLRLFA